MNLVIRSKNTIINLVKEIFTFCKIYYDYDCLYAKQLLPFKEYSIIKPKSDYKIFTYEDFKKLYPTLNDEEKLILLTFYLFGLRIGELMGLTVLSFSAFPNTMCVYQEVNWKTKIKGYRLLSPKTRTSNRNYPLPIKYKQIIDKYIEDNKLKDENFIFFCKKKINKNKPCSEHYINTKLEKWSKIIGYHIHSHLFRHSAVSQLYSQNVPLELISNLVGHSGTTITEKVYLHQTEEKKQALSTFMDSLID